MGKKQSSFSETSGEVNVANQGVFWGDVGVPEIAKASSLVDPEQTLNFPLDC